jgi:hypothetical protein
VKNGSRNDRGSLPHGSANHFSVDMVFGCASMLVFMGILPRNIVVMTIVGTTRSMTLQYSEALAPIGSCLLLRKLWNPSASRKAADALGRLDPSQRSVEAQG